MILAIPVENRNGDLSEVYGHFGSAPFYAFYDSSNEGLEFVDNGNKEHEHGQCQPVQELKEKNVEAVICGGMGIRAINNLNAFGIKVYFAENARTVGEVVKTFKTSGLKELSAAHACQNHHCH